MGAARITQYLSGFALVGVNAKNLLAIKDE